MASEKHEKEPSEDSTKSLKGVALTVIIVVATILFLLRMVIVPSHNVTKQENTSRAEKTLLRVHSMLQTR